jgi:hypothetical protein
MLGKGAEAIKDVAGLKSKKTGKRATAEEKDGDNNTI